MRSESQLAIDRLQIGPCRSRGGMAGGPLVVLPSLVPLLMPEGSPRWVFMGLLAVAVLLRAASG